MKRLFLFLSIWLWAVCGYAQITHNAVANSGYQTAQSSYSFSVNCAGANRYIYVGVSMLSVGGSSVSSITHGGTNLTKITSIASMTGAVRAEFWRLIAPVTGSQTVTITLSAALDSIAGAECLAGVEQTSPEEGTATASATNVGAADATVNVTTTSNNSSWVVDVVATDDTAITVGAGTSRWNVTGALGSGASATFGPQDPATKAMNWTNVAALATWSIIGVGIKPFAVSGYSATGVGTVTADTSSAGLPASETNFQGLIDQTYPALKSTTNGGQLTSSNCYDWTLWSDAAHTVALSWQIETCDTTLGRIRAHVKIPTVVNSYQVFAAFGNPTITTFQGGAAASVWTGYAHVWHFAYTGTTINLTDDVTGNVCTQVTLGARTDGKIDGAAQFNGTDNVIINCGQMNDLNGLTSGTWETWINTPDANGEWIYKGDAALTIWNWVLQQGASSKDFECVPAQQAGATTTAQNFFVGFENVWTYVACVFDGSLTNANRIKLARNGVFQTTVVSGTVATISSTNTQNMSFGGIGVRDMTGSLDEIRFRTNAADQNYLIASYNTQNAPSTFMPWVYTIPVRAWAYKATFTVTANSALLPSSQTNYPLLISATNAALKSVANSGQLTTGNGCFDFVLYKDSALTQIYDTGWETQTCDLTNGIINVFMMKPTLALGDIIYAGIGDPSVTVFQGGPVGSAWNPNYVMVLHLEETGTGSAGDYKDSTANGHNSTNTTAQPSVTATGEIGNAQSVNGSQDIAFANIPAINSLTGFTAMAWVKFASTATGQDIMGMHQSTGLFVETVTSPNAASLAFGFNVSNFPYSPANSNTTGSFVLWHFAFDTALGSHHAIYKNAVSLAQTNQGTPSNVLNTGPSANAFQIFHDPVIGGFMANGGVMDEVRLLNIAEAQNTITVDYNNMSSPSTFIPTQTFAPFVSSSAAGGMMMMGVGK